ncbi:18034_t:CDS:2, partial [Acaulospora morrowiae]
MGLNRLDELSNKNAHVNKSREDIAQTFSCVGSVIEKCSLASKNSCAWREVEVRPRSKVWTSKKDINTY